MNFITVHQLDNDISQNLYKLPSKVDLVVGIPKSGLLLATLIALQLNLPMTDIDGLLENRIYHNGSTKVRAEWNRSVRDCQSILVVDDSIYSGKEMKRVKEKLNKIEETQNVIYMAGYVTSENKNLVDIYLRICGLPRIFEWNYMHHPLLSRTCMDIDGVLCRDPLKHENDDGENYCTFLKTVSPRIIPTYPVGCLVTCRLEKYRTLTEQWLQRNGIQYNELIMMPFRTDKERQKADCYGEFKAGIYKKNAELELFIESSRSEAEVIHRCTGKNVFCIENVMLYDESFVRKKLNYIKTFQFLPIKCQIILKKIKRKLIYIWSRGNN